MLRREGLGAAALHISEQSARFYYDEAGGDLKAAYQKYGRSLSSSLVSDLICMNVLVPAGHIHLISKGNNRSNGQAI